MVKEAPPARDGTAGTPAGQRFRVMLVRLPPGGAAAVQKVLPGERPIDPLELPLITRITSDRVAAEATAGRLRRVGAVVLVTEEPADPDQSAFCVEHPHRLAAITCRRCGTPICDRCQAGAPGEQICPRCQDKGHSRVRNTRLRQLFVLFLFVAFCYEAWLFVSEDEARVSPEGPVRAAIIQLAEPEAMGSPIIKALNRGSRAGKERDGTTLYDIGPWFSAERARYGGRSDWMQVDIRGPWPMQVRPPPLEDPDLPGWRLLWNAWRYPGYFHDIARDFGVDIERYGVRAYIIYGGAHGDLAAHSRGSEEGRIAVSWVSMDEQNPGYAVVTVAHEMGHVLGALDRYDPSTFLSRYPEGYLEPYSEPLFPQRFAELMAVDIPISLKTEREAQGLDQMRIGHRTAAELGWMAKEQADLFYTPPSMGPLDHLPVREEALLP